ncbi:MAG: AraC family transcriptional regulator, partial [Candidatus Devosia euplotis]|nr:AraC family transcriptional regulator [Candidatus Devosia euplotis]
VYRLDSPNDAIGLIYQPVVCLVLQGRKRTFIGDGVLEYGPGECMMVAAELTAMGQVCQASTNEPYLALNLFLDPVVISTILLDMNGLAEPAIGSGFGVAKAGPALLDAWCRLAGLLDQPNEIPVLATRLEHELMFRLLMGPHGALLRQIAGADARLSHIRRAMAFVREHYAEAATVGYAVGYESASQFSREYKRLFGAPPRRDADSLQSIVDPGP